MAIGLGATNAGAQTVDMCGGALSYQADPGEVQKFRQQCTIQRLLSERADEAAQKTGAEVELALERAHIKALSETLTQANAKIESIDKKYTKALIDDIDAVCAWHGTQNEPTAKMCKIWRQK